METTEMMTTTGDSSTSEPRRRPTLADSDDVGLILLNQLRHNN